jgi:hypothetical protein
MIHKLTMGHFDVEALQNRRLVVIRPLDMNVVTRLLREVGELSDDGASLGGHAVEFKDGYVVCPWLMGPQRVSATEEFTRRLQQETGCVLYDIGRREIVTLEQMADW